MSSKIDSAVYTTVTQWLNMSQNSQEGSKTWDHS